MTAPMDIPQTQNTAPVLEFSCLFTSDLRRKQKRWQDGRLRFHAFNKRVMVYDEKSNFVGDMYWREDSELGEGEELQLERGGILVQVGQLLDRKEQDLTEVVGKRKKEKEERAAAKNVVSSPIIFGGKVSTLLHTKPLNSLLAPSGNYGRAMVSHTSPFEERQCMVVGNQGSQETERPVKRRRPNESTQSNSGYAQNLMGATLTLASSKPRSTPTICYEPFKAKPSLFQPPASAIDLVSSEDEQASEVESKYKIPNRVAEKISPSTVQKPRYRKSSPAKNGYASNLTGAALSFVKVEPAPTRITNKPAVINKPSQLKQQEDTSNPSTDDDSNPVDIDVPIPRLVVKQAKELALAPKAKAPKTKAQKTDGKFQKFRSGSSMENDLPSNRTLPESLSNASRVVAKPSPQNLGSSLRIKARPPRKMMMLIDRPSARSSPVIDPSNSLKPKPVVKSKSFDVPGEPVLSQTTRELDAFCKRQQDRLQERFNGKQSHIRLGFEDSSSPLDSDIDHETIDKVFTRKKHDHKPVANPVLEQNGINSKIPPVFEPLSSIPSKIPVAAITKDEILSSAPIRLRVDTLNESQNMDQMEVEPQQGNDSQTRQVSEMKSSTSNQKSPRTAPENNTTEKHNMEVVNDRPVSITRNIKQPANTEEAQIPGSPPPKHVSQALQSAPNQFGEIVKTSAASTANEIKRLQSVPEAAGPSVAQVGEHSQNLGLSAETINQEPPRATDHPTTEAKPTNDVDFSAGNGLRALLQRATSNSMLPPGNGTVNQPKFKLTKPAARPVQPVVATRQWVDQISRRSANSNLQDNPVEDIPATGPWSRESFDLFGSWRPPRKEVPVAVVINAG